MKALIGFIGDRLQAIFPPNRLAILLAGPILAASAWISGVVASNVPGVELPTGVIAGIMGAAALITIRLLDRWFDQWQKGEPIHVDGDLDKALDELADGPDAHALYGALGTMQAVDHAIADLHGRLDIGTVSEADVARSLESIGGVVGGFLEEHFGEGYHAVLHPEEPTPPEAAAGTLKNPAPAPVAPAAEVPPPGR